MRRAAQDDCRHNENTGHDNENTGNCDCGGVLPRRATALKPIDQVALQGTVETIAKEPLLPGAMVLLHTPQGEFVFGYGSTELGVTITPRADTHFRIASMTRR